MLWLAGHMHGSVHRGLITPKLLHTLIFKELHSPLNAVVRPRLYQCGRKRVPRWCKVQATAATQESTRGNGTAGSEGRTSAEAKVVVIVPRIADSPLGKYESVKWLDVMRHMVDRLAWADPRFSLAVYTEDALEAGEAGDTELTRSLRAADVVLVAGLQDGSHLQYFEQYVADVGASLFIECAPKLEALTTFGGIRVAQPGLLVAAAERLSWTKSAKAAKLYDTVRLLWSRHTSDDLLFIFLVLIDAFVMEVETVKALRASDMRAVTCMVRNCRAQIFACLADPECRAALNCLQACAPNDQVCSYRCIASHESPALEQFSLCILQKHNCLGLNATIPARPDPQPMARFRGAPLSQEAAETIFLGWIGDRKWSWRVVAGHNAAYDAFPNQFQLYYRGKGNGTLWYDPVFQVRTLDGREVWRRRHYRVRRAQLPGTFHFSVLDNGVTSKEYWRIIDAPDDLAWALFFYQGAASVVGQSYTGAVLATADGTWPAQDQQDRVAAALDAAGIKTWELFRVDNNSDGTGAPLDILERDAAKEPLARA